jgi:rSAM/selenodomain-associated transferase 1
LEGTEIVDQLSVFAKHWQPGAVKTRLAAAIGHDHASAVYRSFVLCLLKRLAGLADRRVVVYWPPDRIADVQPLAGTAWCVEPQCGEDLGARLHHHLAAALSQGARRVVLVGSDSPTVPREYVARAFDLLGTHPVVLGPAEDGGYYLVGAAGAVPPIFSGIAWSTAHVWEQTVARLRQTGHSFGVLPTWYDVDEVRELIRLRDELERRPHLEPELEGVLDTIRQALCHNGSRP